MASTLSGWMANRRIALLWDARNTTFYIYFKSQGLGPYIYALRRLFLPLACVSVVKKP